jgi:hypothetical protein
VALGLYPLFDILKPFQEIWVLLDTRIQVLNNFRVLRKIVVFKVQGNQFMETQHISNGQLRPAKEPTLLPVIVNHLQSQVNVSREQLLWGNQDPE